MPSMVRLARDTALVLTALMSMPAAFGQTAASSAVRVAAPAPPLQVQAPKGAPNVVVVLLDDVGFAASSTFGGPAETPVLDALAREGLRYNRFHTTGICSPTRAALLSGRNAHAVGIGAVMNSADERHGYQGVHARDAATMAEILRDNGYNTAAFGKWHQTPDWEISQSGPFDRWPTGQGFEKFYGFLGGETDQFEPTLIEGTTPVMRPAGKGYHLTEDLANRAIAWMRVQHSVTPEKPFFLYFAPGATHAPPRLRASGSRSTADVSNRAGTACARRSWRDRKSLAWCRRAQCSRPGPRGCRPGRHSARMTRRSPRA